MIRRLRFALFTGACSPYFSSATFIRIRLYLCFSFFVDNRPQQLLPPFLTLRPPRSQWYMPTAGSPLPVPSDEVVGDILCRLDGVVICQVPVPADAVEWSLCFDKMIDNAVYDVFVGVLSAQTRVVSGNIVFVVDVITGTSCSSPRICIVGFVQCMGR